MTTASPREPVQTVFISADTVDAVLDWESVIDALRNAYASEEDGRANPNRVVAKGDGTWLRSLIATPRSSRFMGGKIFGRSRQRRVSYLIILFDQITGEIAALVDANPITAWRTAATSAVAIERIVDQRSQHIGILGSGAEARAHALAISHVLDIADMTVFSPTPANRSRFVDIVGGQIDCPVAAAETAEQAVVGMDVVIAAARSQDETPILLGEWLDSGMAVVSIGSTLEDQRELDTTTVEKCDLIICDAPEEVMTETGDMIAANQANVSFHDKVISLNDLINGKANARIAAARLPMFKSVGTALQDITVAELAFDKALKANLGTVLPIRFKDKLA